MSKKVEGFIELEADVVFHAACGLKAHIICERERRVQEMVDEIMARPKPSKLKLFFTDRFESANIESANTREEAIEVAKRMMVNIWSYPYYEAVEYRKGAYERCETLASAAMACDKVGEARMMIDLHTADMLAAYFP